MATTRIDAVPSQIWLGGYDSDTNVRVFNNEESAAEWAAVDSDRWVVGPLAVQGVKQRGREIPAHCELYVENVAAAPEAF